VADVTDSVQDVRNYGVANGKPAVLLQVFKQPDANILEAVDKVRACCRSCRPPSRPSM
jgi:multidrug efflux pump